MAIVLATALVSFFRCSSLIPDKPTIQPPDPYRISTLEFAAMGTIFILKWDNPPQSNFSAPYASPLFSSLIEKYDTTFSDWQEQSELRRLEKQGLSGPTPKKASPLFIEGLKFSRLAFDETHELFDITIGAVIWKTRARAVGLTSLEIFPESNAFRFGVDPVRLSFGGLAKGMLTGHLAEIFTTHNVRSFYISAGSGNEVRAGAFLRDIKSNLFSASDIQESLTKGTFRGILFLAHSKTTRGKDQHIIDPRDPSKILQREIHFGCWEKNPSMLRKTGALSDAFATALSIENFRIPESYSCSREISRKL